VAADRRAAREAALIAQARAELGQTAAAPGADCAPAAETVERTAPAAAATPPSTDPQQRIAALMAAARAESERLRLRRRRLYVWAPTAFTCVAGLWALLWMWHRL
jgi:hypothetical protein